MNQSQIGEGLATTTRFSLPSLEGAEQLIPLKRLVASPYNVRRVAPTGIEELADNIAQCGGLLQNLIVHPMKHGQKKAPTFGVAGGDRRRRALLLLLERGVVPDDYPVRCLVVPVEAAILMSVTENEMREPMHPADQCEAYRVLVDAGRTLDDIAAMYGVHVATVQRRLKLARVSPALVDLFRAGEIELQQMQALALSDDHTEQEGVWFEANLYDRQPQRIRARLTQSERPFRGNRTALFVGVDRFEAAGGTVRRDLFSDTGDAWYSDHALMGQLATEGLQGVAAKEKEAGWAWVETRLEFDYHARASYIQISKKDSPPSAEQAEELADIERCMDSIDAELDLDDMLEDRFDALTERYNALSARRDEIRESCQVFDPMDIARGGVIVTIANTGEPQILRGWLRREDVGDTSTSNLATAAANTVTARGDAVGDESSSAVKRVHSEKLKLRLNAHRTLAVGAGLARTPHVALAVLLHRFIAQDHHRSTETALEATLTDHRYALVRAAEELEEDPRMSAIQDRRDFLLNGAPANSAALLAWLIDQTQEALVACLATFVATAVNGVVPHEDAHPINLLCSALDIDIANEWRPTRRAYLDHISKQQLVDIAAANTDAATAVRLAGMKKAEAATELERLLAGTRFVPPHFAACEYRASELWIEHASTEVGEPCDELAPNGTLAEQPCDDGEHVDSESHATPDVVPSGFEIDADIPW
ncbi:ParB/RepB/Spo0J family partition protein [Burkholderia cenocepacia]|uniref:ParB/RepB/Spo0J family partition protein n=1 Tax=Burkholderia cenocepacia TaxID=95486 RepID=UPI000F55C8D1|nr:ParB/RepB/Spo0J family partition protein [Burkholderia cenocepacia]RQU97820.1 ParB/RepB/Spo0J family partition protein [Burkholderia cenocepacia]